MFASSGWICCENTSLVSQAGCIDGSHAEHGLLQRRHVRIEQIKCIGKESNSLEEVESGLMHSEQSVYTLYEDPRRDEWQTRILPALKKASLTRLVELSGLSRSTLIEIRAARSRPHRKNQELLMAFIRKLAIK